MPASLMMALATLLFATMGVCVKLASAEYSSGEIVMYRGLIGVAMVSGLVLARGLSLRTAVPAMHFWRGASGVAALSLWFYAIGKLPLPTAMTLNYMSSVWMALFLIGGSVLMGSRRVDGRLVACVLAGFLGVALVLRPSMHQEQAWYGLAGLLAGMLAAMAYLQVTALGRAGEPEHRIVFYFSLGGALAGALVNLAEQWHRPTAWHAHTPRGLALLLAVGLLATAAQLLMTAAYRRGKTLVNASLQYLGIVFSCLYGVWIFQEPLEPAAILGMLLIVGAGLAATLLRNRSIPSDSPHSASES